MKGKTLFLFLLVSCLIISSCGSGGGGNSSPSPNSSTQSIAGIWIGTFTSSVTNSTYNVTGLIDESYNARFADPDNLLQYSGVVSINGNSFSSTATAYAPSGYTFPDDSQVGTVNISGSFSEKTSINGTYTGVGDTGVFFLNYSALYERASSLALVAGTWSGTVLGYTNTITVDSSGNVSGDSSSGCTYTGNVGIVDSSYNAYNVTLNINNCGTQNGSYSGLAALTDTVSANDTILVCVSNASYSFVASLRRQ
jgi:hypothetical protein